MIFIIIYKKKNIFYIYINANAHNFIVENKLWLKIAVGAAAGAVSGFIGGGGGMLVVPLLSFCLGCGGKRAHATAIAVILPIAVISSVVSLFSITPEWSELIPTVIGVTVGGVVGSFVLKAAPSFWVSIVFSALMAAVGVKTLFF